jgi:hypothetical protein
LHHGDRRAQSWRTSRMTASADDIARRHTDPYYSRRERAHRVAVIPCAERRTRILVRSSSFGRATCATRTGKCGNGCLMREPSVGDAGVSAADPADHHSARGPPLQKAVSRLQMSFRVSSSRETRPARTNHYYRRCYYCTNFINTSHNSQSMRIVHSRHILT